MVTLNTEKESIFENFQNYLINTYNCNDSFSEELYRLSEGAYDPNKYSFYNIVYSPFNKEYLKRNQLPVNLGLNIYNYCNKINNIEFFYFILYKFFASEWWYSEINGHGLI